MSVSPASFGRCSRWHELLGHGGLPIALLSFLMLILSSLGHYLSLRTRLVILLASGAS